MTLCAWNIRILASCVDNLLLHSITAIEARAGLPHAAVRCVTNYNCLGTWMRFFGPLKPVNRTRTES